MSSRSLRRVSAQDMDLVKNLMENCLQQYMSRKETVEKLLHEAKIDPVLTEITWQRLENENKEFFQAYYAKLALKQQMEEFNRLLKKQMQSLQPQLVQPLNCVATSQDLISCSYPEIAIAFCDQIKPSPESELFSVMDQIASPSPLEQIVQPLASEVPPSTWELASEVPPSAWKQIAQPSEVPPSTWEQIAQPLASEVPPSTWELASEVPPSTWKQIAQPLASEVPPSTWELASEVPPSTWEQIAQPLASEVPPSTWELASSTWEQIAQPLASEVPPSTWELASEVPPSTWELR